MQLQGCKHHRGRLPARATTTLLALLLLVTAQPQPAAGRLLRPSFGSPLGSLTPGGADVGQTATEVAADAGRSKTYYIFGYGSLLNRQSTAKTDCGLAGISEGTLAGLEALFRLARDAPLSDALKACEVKNPRVVRIQGLRRGFFVPGKVGGVDFPPFHPWPESAFLLGYCPLGAVFEPGYTTTGLIYEVNEKQYNATRQREGGYLTKTLDDGTITVLGGPPLPRGAQVTAFAFPPDNLTGPSSRLPLSSSYIDVWLSGALDLQSEFSLTGDAYREASGGLYSSFVEETIRTTEGWSRFWVNDRAVPLRSFVMSPEAFQVDAALWEWAPHDALEGIRFPGQPLND